jgi:hypothetical protein
MGDPGQPKAPADAGAQPATRTQPAANAAPFVVSFASQPDPPHVGENAFEVTVKEAGGQPVTDARVNVMFFMPAMPSMGMPAMKSSAVLGHAGAGVYRGAGQVASAGRWDVTVTVDRGGRRVATRRLGVVVR